MIFDTANAHAYNDKFPETLGAFVVKLEKGDTVYDALVKTGIDFDARGRSYIKSISGIAEKVCGANSGWLYLVDGVQPAKNASDFELEGGETVLWAYTVKQGDVEGSVPMPDPPAEVDADDAADASDAADAPAEGKAA